MKLEQAYYTSCKAGLRSGMGFQFNAVSEGLPPSTLQWLERLGLYVAPLSAPARPTEAELAQFPVTLLFQPLPDGSAVVACARYVGQDYSGRFGNYFTHFVLAPTPAADFRDVLPIELWGSALWQSRESESKVLPPLPTLPAGGMVDPLSVSDFLARDGRAARLPAMLTAVEQALASRKRIVLVDRDDAVAAWIAAVSYALPRSLALGFSFTTYTKTPYQTDALLAGTTPDSDFRFAPHEIEQQFSVFDFVGNRFSPCPSPSRFSRAVADAYAAGHAESVAGFAEFVAHAAPAIVAEELAVAFETYGIVRGFAPAGTAAPELSRWCAAHVSTFEPEALERVFVALVQDGAASLTAVDGLARAVLAEPTLATRHRAGLERYFEWLVREAAMQAEVAVLQTTLGRPFPDTAVPLARPFLSSWLQQAREGLDEARAGAMLLVGDRLGYFREHQELLRRAGEHFVGPSLENKATQDLLVSLAGQPGGKPLLDGLGEHLSARVAEPRVFVSLSPLLRQAGIGPALEQYALGRKASGLYLRLVGARAGQGGGTTFARFQECIDELARHGMAVTSAHLENAYDALWGGSAPEADEALKLVSSPIGPMLAGTSIPAQLARGIAATSVLEATHERLASALATLPGVAAQPEIRSVLKAFEVTKAARGNGDPVRLVRDALDCGSALPPPMGDAMREVAASCLLRVADRHEHGRLLAQACVAGGEKFAMGYVRALRALLDREQLQRATTFARFYRAWGELERHSEDRGVSYVLAPGLSYVLERWSSRELEDVTRALQDSPNARTRWTTWLAQRRGTRGRTSTRPTGAGPQPGGVGGDGGWIVKLLSLFGLRSR